MLEIGCGGFRVTPLGYHRVDVDAARVDRTRYESRLPRRLMLSQVQARAGNGGSTPAGSVFFWIRSVFFWIRSVLAQSHWLTTHCPRTSSKTTATSEPNRPTHSPLR